MLRFFVLNNRMDIYLNSLFHINIMVKIAFITGITGQDGSYLAELLLEKDYDVWGIIRRSSSINTKRIDDIYEDKNVKKLLRFFITKKRR